MSEERPRYTADVPRNRKTKGGKLRVAAVDRQRQALDLRRAGATYQQIADRLGYTNKSGAFKAIQTALRTTLKESADELRQLELCRLDAMQLGVWRRATRGDDGAIRSVIRIMQRRAALLGLDAPTKVSGEVMLKQITEQAAKDAGLDPDRVLAEAQRILDELGM